MGLLAASGQKRLFALLAAPCMLLSACTSDREIELQDEVDRLQSQVAHLQSQVRRASASLDELEDSIHRARTGLRNVEAELAAFDNASVRDSVGEIETATAYMGIGLRAASSHLEEARGALR